MDSHSLAEWYLDIEGKPVGPYSLDQIEAFIREGRVRSQHRISSHTLGRWISVQELLQQMAERAGLPKQGPPPPPFSPPPRPREVEDMTTGILKRPAELASKDPAQSLLASLQAVRERNTIAKLTPPSPREWGQVARPAQAKMTTQVWLIASVTSLLWVGVWGVTHIMKTSEPAAAPQSQAQAVAPAPVAPPPQPTRTVATPPAQRPYRAIHNTATESARVVRKRPEPSRLAPQRDDRANNEDDRRDEDRRRDEERRDERNRDDPRDERDPRDLRDPRDSRDARYAKDSFRDPRDIPPGQEDPNRAQNDPLQQPPPELTTPPAPPDHPQAGNAID